MNQINSSSMSNKYSIGDIQDNQAQEQKYASNYSKKSRDYEKIVLNADVTSQRVEKKLVLLNNILDERKKSTNQNNHITSESQSNRKKSLNSYVDDVSQIKNDNQYLLESIPPKLQYETNSSIKLNKITEKLSNLMEMMDVVCSSPNHAKHKDISNYYSTLKQDTTYNTTSKNSDLGGANFNVKKYRTRLQNYDSDTNS